jgi:hypothetical protein
MPPAAQLATLQKELRRGAARAKSQFGRSAALSHLKSGVVDAAIGTIVGLPLGSPTAAVVSAGSSEVALLLYRWLNGLPSRRALARHYPVFTSSAG